MKILGIITARGNSKRIANKNTLVINGKPVICWTIDAAKKSKAINRVVCSTDSLEIISLVKRSGIEAVQRPARIASDTSPIEDALRHTVSFLREKEGYMPDIIVLLYANVPFRSSSLIDGAISQMISRNADAVVSVSPTERYHPERLVRLGARNLFNPYVKKFSTYRRQELSQVYFIDSGVIVLKPRLLFDKDPLIISHYFKGCKVFGYASHDVGAWDIDNDFDIEIAKLLLCKKSKKARII